MKTWAEIPAEQRRTIEELEAIWVERDEWVAKYRAERGLEYTPPAKTARRRAWETLNLGCVKADRWEEKPAKFERCGLHTLPGIQFCARHARGEFGEFAGLSPRTVTALWRNRVSGADALALMSDRQLSALTNLGKVGLAEIRQWLAARPPKPLSVYTSRDLVDLQ